MAQPFILKKKGGTKKKKTLLSTVSTYCTMIDDHVFLVLDC